PWRKKATWSGISSRRTAALGLIQRRGLAAIAETPIVATSAPNATTAISRSTAYGSGTKMAATGAEKKPASSSHMAAVRPFVAMCHTPTGTNTTSGSRNTPVWRGGGVGGGVTPPREGRAGGQQEHKKRE